MFGVLRKPRLGKREISNGPGIKPSERDYVEGIFIEPDGAPNDRVFAVREALAFNADGFLFGSQRYVENPPRVEFDVDPNDPRRAVSVRLA
jgi:hypothetical protein